MKFANVRELHNHTGRIINLAEKEDVVITVRGKPKAVLRRLQEEDLEDYVLAHHPRFQKLLEAAWEDYRQTGGVELNELTERLKRGHAALPSSADQARPKRTRKA